MEKGDRKGRLYYERLVLHGRVIVEATARVAFLLTTTTMHKSCPAIAVPTKL
ncbi:MAG TPA: hypothetical protein VFQ36_02285 [Ktedonobacteraceae bacterium]|nr:hypothetical protein [Ktedonobacteraceae bacterium]